jgi:hypothetical protein
MPALKNGVCTIALTAERAVAVAADREPGTVDDGTAIQFVDYRREAVPQVVYIVVILLPLRPDDRYGARSIDNHRIPEPHEKLHGPAAETLELILVERAIRPVNRVLGFELPRIEPEDRRRVLPMKPWGRSRCAELNRQALDREALHSA